MKKLFYVLSLVLITYSCEKTKIQDPDLPSWLKDRINQDEQIIKSNPQSGLDIAAWIRYEYKGKFYYEYLNLLSSAGPEIYQDDGTKVKGTEIDILDYQSKRCCRIYIWKGPSYIDI